jgi:hypothetical protein
VEDPHFELRSAELPPEPSFSLADWLGTDSDDLPITCETQISELFAKRPDIESAFLHPEQYPENWLLQMDLKAQPDRAVTEGATD